MKKYIPNILTTYRLVIALCIPYLFIDKQYILLMILLITAVISDLFDGMLARMWNTTSTYGKITDMIADKLLAITSIGTFIITINNYFIIILVLELLIIIINVTYCIKIKNFDGRKSSMYGKVKTGFLFSALLVGFLSYIGIDSFFNSLIIPLIVVTSILQAITAIDYLIKNHNQSC